MHTILSLDHSCQSCDAVFKVFMQPVNPFTVNPEMSLAAVWTLEEGGDLHINRMLASAVDA